MPELAIKRLAGTDIFISDIFFGDVPVYFVFAKKYHAFDIFRFFGPKSWSKRRKSMFKKIMQCQFLKFEN